MPENTGTATASRPRAASSACASRTPSRPATRMRATISNRATPCWCGASPKATIEITGSGATSITVEDGVSLNPHHFGGFGSSDHVWMGAGAAARLSSFHFSDAAGPVTLFDLWKGNATVYLTDTELPSSYAATIGFGPGSRVDPTTWQPDIMI